MTRYICIHGHFYQPPRENAWLEVVEAQDSAYPFHDWNERITSECYAPNAHARILDGRKRIARIVNNYERISYNVGPTLMSWLDEHAPETYRAILDADRRSVDAHEGHGCAMAQAYSHPILPLCNARDKRTQVLWGSRDFEFRYGRTPEGMWLPETAVDLATLEVLASAGLRYTILSPSQAAAVRAPGQAEWQEMANGSIDPRRPYRVALAGGGSIDVFFYDDAISRGVAFEHLLGRGEQFARRLLEGFDGRSQEPQLVHIATDGESYGHHHAHGDMALAYATELIEARDDVRLVPYAAYLARYPATWEARIVENSAWSCSHGLGRWSTDCGCASEIRRGWTQEWRAPLRACLDWLRDELAPRYERTARELLRDPWAARDAYIDVILDRSPQSRERFLTRHGTGRLAEREQRRVLELLEMQRNLLLMYTSCAWFFEDSSRIETVQVLQYAVRAAELAQGLFGEPFEDSLLRRLEHVPSNVAEFANARRIYDARVRPFRADPAKFGANYAASLLFADGRSEWSGGYEVIERDRRGLEAGRARLVVGRIEVNSRTTLERSDLTFGFVHLGDHNFSGGVRPYRGPEAYTTMVDEVAGAFAAGEIPETMRRLDRHFIERAYSLGSLFRDEQRRVLDRVLHDTLEDAEGVYRGLYERNASLIRFLGGLDAPTPPALRTAAELVLNAGLRRELSADEVDPQRLAALLEEARSAGLTLDGAGLAYAAGGTLEGALESFALDVDDAEALVGLAATAQAIVALPFPVDLFRAQNLFWGIREKVFPDYWRRAEQADAAAVRWVETFRRLGRTLGVSVEATGSARSRRRTRSS